MDAAEPLPEGGEQEKKSMDGEFVSTSLYFSMFIKIVQMGHSEDNHVLLVKVNISWPRGRKLVQ